MSIASDFVAKGAEFLDSKSYDRTSCDLIHGSDRPVPGDWREIIAKKGDDLNMGSIEDCVLGTLFKSRNTGTYGAYYAGLAALGLASGIKYGFESSEGASYSDLKDAWLEYVGAKSPAYTVGDTFAGRWYSGSALKIVDTTHVNGALYFVVVHGSYKDGEYDFPANKPQVYSAKEISDEFKAKSSFSAKEGDLITSRSAGKTWYVGNNRAWSIVKGVPSSYVSLESLIADYDDLEHLKTATGNKVVGYDKF
ncbi:MAG TPA: hypothetical protein VIY48_19110 [Candidatus Paceibacterota bacterium]